MSLCLSVYTYDLDGLLNHFFLMVWKTIMKQSRRRISKVFIVVKMVKCHAAAAEEHSFENSGEADLQRAAGGEA